jgi:hypothetical protein
MPANKPYTYPLLCIKDKEVETTRGRITLPSNADSGGDDSIDNINNYTLVDLLIKAYEDMEKVVVGDRVLDYLRGLRGVLKKEDDLADMSAANRGLLAELRVGVYNRWFRYLQAHS